MMKLSQKSLGLVLVAVAFIWGAYLTSLDKLHVDWSLFAAAALLGVFGIYLAKKGERALARDGAVLDGNLRILDESLSRILTVLQDLDSRKEAIPTYDMRFEIDNLLRDDLFAFADARDSMKYLFGLQSYADVMSAFAAGERYINRVWSASTDGYIDEVTAFVTKSRQQFEAARAEFDKARAASEKTA